MNSTSARTRQHLKDKDGESAMSRFLELASGLEWREGEQFLRVEAWGSDGIRVRAGLGTLIENAPGALDREPALGHADRCQVIVPGSSSAASGSGGAVDFDGSGPAVASVTRGSLRAEVNSAGMIRFCDAEGGGELLAERRIHFASPGPRHFDPHGRGRYRITQQFAAYPDERVYGLGQYQHGLLDQKGAVIDLVQRNGEVTIPFLLSNRGYGMLWNSPAVGSVHLAANGTRWISDDARQIDYWITAGGSPAEVIGRYVDATGHAPVLPGWATGFWQSKLRYRTQDELLAVAREYHARGLPLAVIVADFFHWRALGDWKFDARDWPDPKAMVDELAAMGTRLMVSVWPSVSPASENFAALSERGLLVAAEYGPAAATAWRDDPADTPTRVAFYDSTHPEARRFIWEAVESGYGAHGIDVYWLDACEPEISPLQPANLRLHAGNGSEAANLYPREHARAFHEGRERAGRHEGLSFSRSAWAGSQRYGTAVWSGDIGVDFETLRRQITAGMNIGISGIPWWCADIGGFHGGDPEDPAYREVMIRWFQFGALSPIFRMHGDRTAHTPSRGEVTGGPNEIWSYGPEAEQIMTDYLHLRERLRPYLDEQMRTAAANGLPPMRALFLQFPDDPAAWGVTDQYLLGPDLLVAPVLEPGATSRPVYLPAGARWHDAWTGADYTGGTHAEIPAPLDRIPLLLRDNATLPITPRSS